MNASRCYRRILRSSSLMAAASLVHVVCALIRFKLAAVLLGPAGLGLIGILQSLMNTAATMAALGLGTAGTRQVAEAVARGEDVARTRSALFWGTLILALAGGVGVYTLRHLLAEHLLADPGRADEVAWLALGVALAVAAGSQAAFLNGMRRIGDLARLKITSALAATLIGILALLLWRDGGIILFVIAAPIANWILGHVYVARIAGIGGARPPLAEISQKWRAMAALGVAFMAGSLSLAAGHLAVRSLVNAELGSIALGHFQAAFAISATYLAFVLSAMGTDYYPHLTALIDDREAAARLVNAQTEVALLLAGPVLMTMLAFAPLVLRILYTAEFEAAATVLRWQTLGDILKVASWPLGFLLLASGAARTYFLAELLAIGVFLGGTWALLPVAGLSAPGLAQLLCYAAYLPTVFWLARRRIGFAWSAAVSRQIGALLVSGTVVALAAHQLGELAAAGLGASFALALGLQSASRLLKLADLGGSLPVFRSKRFKQSAKRGSASV